MSWLGLLGVVAISGGGTVPDAKPAMALGADVSWLRQAEEAGKQFRRNGNARPALQILHEGGHRWIRLRLFVEPVKDGLPNGLAYTTALARDAKARGFRLLLNFHYAQTWADPGQQPTPDAWQGLSAEALAEKVLAHTRDSIRHLRQAGAAPDAVQVGNEVIGGMLWPTGRIPDHWNAFEKLLRAGIRGVREAQSPGRRIPVLIHIDRGGDWPATQWFFDELRARRVEFDAIGHSYYPWWHGSLDQLRVCLTRTAERYGKDVWLVETAYHWRPDGETQGKPVPFPNTPEGQRDFLRAVTQVVAGLPNGRGKAVFWWEAATSGQVAGRTLFRPDGEALPALDVFRELTSGAPQGQSK